MDHNYYVYIITNRDNTVLYTGVTNNIIRRIYEHKEKLINGFSKKYNCDKLVWYEIYENAYSAISREKQIKAGSRRRKVMLVNSMNLEWKDLYGEVVMIDRDIDLIIRQIASVEDSFAMTDNNYQPSPQWSLPELLN